VIKKSLCTWWLQHTSYLPHYLAQSDCLAADRQGQGDTRLTLTPSLIPNSNYVIMVSDWNCLKYFCVFFLCIVIIRCTQTFWSPLHLTTSVLFSFCPWELLLILPHHTTIMLFPKEFLLILSHLKIVVLLSYCSTDFLLILSYLKIVVLLSYCSTDFLLILSHLKIVVLLSYCSTDFLLTLSHLTAKNPHQTLP
jgi:hypothetical protein